MPHFRIAATHSHSPRRSFEHQMAIVKFGISVVGIRKTIGGVTFSNSPSGPNAKLWTPSSMPFSPAQTAQQARVATLASPWNLLGPSAQADWNNFGLTPPETDTNSLGHVYFLSGYQWYIRVNTRNQLSGEPRLDTPPVGGAVSPPTTVALTAATLPTPSVIATFDAAPFTPAPYAVALLKSHQGQGVRSPHSAFYATPIVDVSGTTSLDLTAAALALFGILVAGNTLFLRLRCQTTEGLRSPFVSAYCAVT